MTPADCIAAIPQFRDIDPGKVTVEPLDGLTNRSYRISIGGERFALRISGASTALYIDRRREAANAHLAAAAGVAPEVIWQDTDRGVMLCRHVDADQPLNNEDLANDETLCSAAELLRRLHRSGAPFEGRLSPGAEFDRYVVLAKQQGSRHAEALAHLRRDSDRLRSALGPQTFSIRAAPCHVDPVPANFINDGTRLWLLDWEYAAMADPLWDLACLALEARLLPDQQRSLLGHYFATMDDNLERRFLEQLVSVSAVGLAWTALQSAVGNDSVNFEGEYQRRLACLSAVLANAVRLPSSAAE